MSALLACLVKNARCRLRACRRKQEVEQPFFCHLLSPLLDQLKVACLDHTDRQFRDVADDGFHITPDVPHLGELGGFDFQKGSLRQLRQSSRNFSLADTSRADHDDVLRHDLFANVRAQLLPSPTVTQRDGHHALGVLLADDIAIQFLHDLARSQVVEAGRLRAGLRGHG